MLRRLADLADAGEIDAMAIVVSYSAGGMSTGLSTPQNAYYALLGNLDELRDQIKAQQKQAPQKTRTEY